MKCDFPPCDNNATKHVVAQCKCGNKHIRWDARVCDVHLSTCESVARELLEPSHVVSVVSLVGVN